MRSLPYLVLFTVCLTLSLLPNGARLAEAIPPAGILEISAAQPTSPTMDREYRQALTAEVEGTLLRWAAALRRRDLRAHMDHYDEHLFIYFTWRNVSWEAVYADKRRFIRTYPTVREYILRKPTITLTEKC